jgi:hypothetical protein
MTNPFEANRFEPRGVDRECLIQPGDKCMKKVTVKGKLTSIRKSVFNSSEAWQKRRLVKRIDALLMSALGHEDAGAAIGDRVYRLLYGEALQLVDHHQANYNLDPIRLRAHLPSLHRLEKLASPEEPLF